MVSLPLPRSAALCTVSAPSTIVRSEYGPRCALRIDLVYGDEVPVAKNPVSIKSSKVDDLLAHLRACSLFGISCPLRIVLFYQLNGQLVRPGQGQTQSWLTHYYQSRDDFLLGRPQVPLYPASPNPVLHYVSTPLQTLYEHCQNSNHSSSYCYSMPGYRRWLLGQVVSSVAVSAANFGIARQVQ